MEQDKPRRRSRAELDEVRLKYGRANLRAVGSAGDEQERAPDMMLLDISVPDSEAVQLERAQRIAHIEIRRDALDVRPKVAVLALMKERFGGRNPQFRFTGDANESLSIEFQVHDSNVESLALVNQVASELALIFNSDSYTAEITTPRPQGKARHLAIIPIDTTVQHPDHLA